MKLELVSADQIARSFGLITSGGEPSRRALAQVLRSFSERQDMATRRRLLRHAREQVSAAGLSEAFPADSVDQVLDQLIAQGDYQLAGVGHQAFAIPGIPRWIAIGGGKAALIGIAHIPSSLRLWTLDECNDLVRRCDVSNEDALAALKLGGFSATSWDDWLEPLGYVAHMIRREDRPIRSDVESLSSFWSLLNDRLVQDGYPLSPDAQIRYLTGKRGSFFGNRSALTCEGRWTDTAVDGIWCAYRKGFGESHWHPIVVDVDGDSRRCLDLFDDDEWRWAILARSAHENQLEKVTRSGDRISVSFPLPWQIAAAMDLLGNRVKAWEWQVAIDAPDIWSHIR